MTRDEARQHLTTGTELDGLVLDHDGQIAGRGKIKWQGTTLLAVRAGLCTDLQLSLNGDTLTVPLVTPVTVRRGEPIQIEFGPTWQNRQRRA